MVMKTVKNVYFAYLRGLIAVIGAWVVPPRTEKTLSVYLAILISDKITVFKI